MNYYSYPGLPPQTRYLALSTSLMTDPTIDALKNIVAFAFDVTVEQMESKRRNHMIALARHCYSKLLRKRTDLSYRAIGATIGNRDHSTVLKSVETAEALLESYPNFARRYKLADIMSKGARNVEDAYHLIDYERNKEYRTQSA